MIPGKAVKSREEGGIKDMAEDQDKAKWIEKLLEELIGEATEGVFLPIRWSR